MTRTVKTPEELMTISPETEKRIQWAWETRRQNFPDELRCDLPDRTLPVSLTGTACALDCAHCGGHYLEGMTPHQSAPHKLAGGDYASCLISGGCSQAGSVEVANRAQFVKTLRKQGLRINMHVGLLTPEEIAKVVPLADSISFDVVSDDETIHEVFGLSRSGQAYLETYQRLIDAGAPVTPHICIGLKGGEICGEYEALEQVARMGAAALVFIVLIPTPGTRYADRQPPTLDEVAQVFIRARELFPDKPINLGCMRPKGRYRAELDKLAVRCGLNRLVNPTSPAVKLATEMGLKLHYGRECCTL